MMSTPRRAIEAVAAWLVAVLASLPLAAQAAAPGPETDLAGRVAGLAEHGYRLLEIDDFVGAGEVFRQVRVLAPPHRDGLLGMGQVHLGLGDGELALAYASAVRAADASDDEAAALEVRALLRLRRFDDAVRSSSQAILDIASAGAALWAAHASALFRVQRNEEAAAAYRQVLRLEPLHAEANIRLGSGLTEPGPGPLSAELEAAASALAAKRLDQAIAQLGRVLAVQAQHAIGRRLLGEALLQQSANRSFIATATEFAALNAALPPPTLSGGQVGRFMPQLNDLDPVRFRAAAHALGLFESLLPRLVAMGGQHDLLQSLERTTDAAPRAALRGKRTFDGRVWDDVRGIGGLRAATGIEALDEAAQFGFDTLAHEIAHQVHLYAFTPDQRRRIRDLYQAAMAEDRCLDYYAANNEAEYFGQGVEAFAALAKRPGRETTHGHTRFELYRVDPALHDFIAEVVDCDPLRSETGRRRILPAAVEVALRCGRAEDAVVAATMLDAGPLQTALMARARRAQLLSRSW